MLGRMACDGGLTGYLPLYLRQIGWTAASADGALAAANLAGMIAAVPLALLSDRLGLRKMILFVAILATAIGVGLLSISDGAMVWVAAILGSFTRDGFMAVAITMITETEGVGAAYTGTALGLAMTLSRMGKAFSPSAGNSLAGISPGLPFIFWAALDALALFALPFVKETGQKRV